MHCLWLLCLFIFFRAFALGPQRFCFGRLPLQAYLLGCLQVPHMAGLGGTGAVGSFAWWLMQQTTDATWERAKRESQVELEHLREHLWHEQEQRELEREAKLTLERGVVARRSADRRADVVAAASRMDATSLRDFSIFSGLPWQWVLLSCGAAAHLTGVTLMFLLRAVCIGAA